MTAAGARLGCWGLQEGPRWGLDWRNWIAKAVYWSRVALAGPAGPEDLGSA